MKFHGLADSNTIIYLDRLLFISFSYISGSPIKYLPKYEPPVKPNNIKPILT